MPDSAAPSPPPAPPPRRTWPDSVLAGLVVGFAFLAASFAARNSDLWLHLAAGRLLARGEYHFGADPFGYTTAGVHWANHAWLSDLALYLGYQRLGGGGLVALKAGLVAVLAAVMLRTSRSRGPFWVAAGCVLLAVLAMSPRVLLQPACLSLLLLAVCVELLRTGGRALYALPAVVALWANLDGWFVLGPLLVGLFWVGRLIAPRDPAAPRFPVWLLPACVAACLLTPDHVRGLTVPPELSPTVWAGELADDPRFAGVFASPWHADLFRTASGSNVPALAYLALLGLGVVSFAVNRRAARGWRGVVWLAFGLLGAWQARLVPFFAVVAGPIAALNFRDVLPAGLMPRAGRGLTALAALALAALAWTGWLQGLRAHDRGVAWAVVPNPSLERAAGTLARWRQEKLLPDDARTFTTHPDAAHHLVWFCPGERVFLDSRLPLFADSAADYLALSRAVGAIPEGEGDSRERADRLLREHNIGCVLLADPNPSRLAGELQTANAAADRWELARIDGAAVLVGAKANPAARPRVPPFDAARSAFAPPGDGDPPPAPADGPGGWPDPAPWWKQPLERRSRTAWERDAAGVYLELAGLPRRGPQADDPARPAALPLLAVRAARTAIAARPDDPGGWSALARGYLALVRATGEGEGPTALPPLQYVRHVQTAAALAQVVALDPDSAAAHEALAALFGRRQFLDLALRHLREGLRIARRAGPLPGEPRSAYDDRLRRLTEAADQVEGRVQDAENRFVVRTHALAGDPFARAQVALQLGLPGKAIDGVLLKSHPDLYGPDGLRMLTDLLLQTGRAGEARVLLDRAELRANPGALGAFELPGGVTRGRRWGYAFHAYDWFDLAESAAQGRYDRAAAALDRLRERLRGDGEGTLPALAAGLALRVAADAGAGAAPAASLARQHSREERERFAALVVQARFLDVERADLHALDGMLLLERGEPAAAAGQFDLALRLYDRAKDASPVTPGRPLCARYLSAVTRHAR